MFELVCFGVVARLVGFVIGYICGASTRALPGPRPGYQPMATGKPEGLHPPTGGSGVVTPGMFVHINRDGSLVGHNNRPKGNPPTVRRRW